MVRCCLSDWLWEIRESVWMLSHIWLCAPLWTVAHQAPLSMGFFRQEYWSGLPFPSAGDLPNQGASLPTSIFLADSLWPMLTLTKKFSSWGEKKSRAASKSQLGTEAIRPTGFGDLNSASNYVNLEIDPPRLYLWTSLVAQMVKNLPTIRETWVWSLSWEDPLEKGMATHTSILACRTPMDRGASWATVHGVAKSQTWLKQFSMDRSQVYITKEIPIPFTLLNNHFLML